MTTQPHTPWPDAGASDPAVADWRPAEDMADLRDPVLFPKMPAHLVEAVRPMAKQRAFAPGEVLFEHGQRNAPFFIVESGRVVFFDRNRCDQHDTYFSSVSSGMFIGDTAMFTGEPTVAECRAYEPTRVLELTHEQACRFIRENSEAGDLILTTLMARRAWLEGNGYGQLQLIGPNSCPCTYRMRDFLTRNQIPFVWRDTEADERAARLLEEFEVPSQEIPVLLEQGELHRNPELRCIAERIGLLPELRSEPYDLAVIGAGPAGLAAAVYGASEGLNVLVLDASAPGGQAGTSSKIENYLGFTTGISGAELARQAVLQARKFGATLCNPAAVRHIDCHGPTKRLTLDDGRVVEARTVVLAMGARYRRLDAEGCRRFEGAGVYYAAGHLEATHCHGASVVVVGGGNSAGQAAVFLSRHAKRVYMVIRRDSLAETMSRYLIDRIEREPNIELIARSEVERLDGDKTLQQVELRGPDGPRTVDVAAVFVMIGADPHTEWLDGCCGLDDRGFIVTGQDAVNHPRSHDHWTADRPPSHLETTRPGIFAVGDVRSGSVKRVATAVGEGAMAVPFVHRAIAASG